MIKVVAVKGTNSIVGVEFVGIKPDPITIPPFETIYDFQGRVLDPIPLERRMKAMDRLHGAGIYITAKGEMIL